MAQAQEGQTDYWHCPGYDLIKLVITEHADGIGKATVTITPDHLNYAGVGLGAFTFAAADAAARAAVTSHLEKAGKIALTATGQITYRRPVTLEDGSIVAEAKIESMDERKAVVTAIVRSASSGREVATCSFEFAIREAMPGR